MLKISLTVSHYFTCVNSSSQNEKGNNEDYIMLIINTNTNKINALISIYNDIYISFSTSFALFSLTVLSFNFVTIHVYI